MKHKPSDEEMRMMLTPGRVRVAAGNMTYVKYEASGTSRKNPVLCLHGFPDNPDTFMHLGRKLAKMGHDVYVPYLRGYEIGTAKVGISFDCKRGVCDDIVTLINSLKLKEDIHLIGHDWGAFIVSVLAQKIPESFASVTMMAVPHNFVPGAASLPRQLLKSWFVNFFPSISLALTKYISHRYMFFFQIPFLPEQWLLNLGGFERLVRSWSPTWTPPAMFLRSVKSTFSAKNVATCAISYYRHFLGIPHVLVAVFLPAVWILSISVAIIVSFVKPNLIYDIWIQSGDRSISVPTLGLTGSNDGCVDTSLFDRGMTAYPHLFPKGLKVKRVQKCGHWLHLERPDIVAKAIIKHLNDSEREESKQQRSDD